MTNLYRASAALASASSGSSLSASFHYWRNRWYSARPGWLSFQLLVLPSGLLQGSGLVCGKLDHYLDVTQVATPRTGPERAAVIARRIRQLGLGRVLYGSDGALPDNLPRDNWAAFRRLPLTDSEFETIANNLAPYMR